mgnify:CR=1 FL=1|jgi:hypothetical protein
MNSLGGLGTVSYQIARSVAVVGAHIVVLCSKMMVSSSQQGYRSLWDWQSPIDRAHPIPRVVPSQPRNRLVGGIVVCLFVLVHLSTMASAG